MSYVLKCKNFSCNLLKITKRKWCITNFQKLISSKHKNLPFLKTFSAWYTRCILWKLIIFPLSFQHPQRIYVKYEYFLEVLRDHLNSWWVTNLWKCSFLSHIVHFLVLTKRCPSQLIWVQEICTGYLPVYVNKTQSGWYWSGGQRKGHIMHVSYHAP